MNFHLDIILKHENVELKIENQIKTINLSSASKISELIFQIAHSPEFIQTKYCKYELDLNKISNKKFACDTIFNIFSNDGINLNNSLSSDQIFIAKQLKIKLLEEKVTKWESFCNSFQKNNDFSLIEEIQKRFLNLNESNFNENLSFFERNLEKLGIYTFFLILCKVYDARPQKLQCLFSIVNSLSKIEGNKTQDGNSNCSCKVTSENKENKCIKINDKSNQTDNKNEPEEESQNETETEVEEETESQKNTESEEESQNETKTENETEEESQNNTNTEDGTDEKSQNETETEVEEEKNNTETEKESQNETETDVEEETESRTNTESEEESQNETKTEDETEEESQNETETDIGTEEEIKNENKTEIKNDEKEIKTQINNETETTQQDNQQTNNRSLLQKFTTFILKNSYFLFNFQHRKRALFYRILYNNDLIDRSKINLFPFQSDSGLFYQTGRKEINSNPDNISMILRKDDIDSLILKYNEDSNFDINSNVKDSTFETCEIIEQMNYLCYCAFYGSTKCFDFLISNKAKYTSDLVLFAVAGGNVHIIHQCEYIGLDFRRNEALFMAIQYHQNDVCDWLIETKFNDDIDFIQLENVCLNYCNFEMFFKFVEKGFLSFYFFKFIAKFKIKFFYIWLKSFNLFFLIKNEITNHLIYLFTLYEKFEDEIIDIFKIIIEMIPDLPNDAIDLINSDKKYEKLLFIYQQM